MENKNTYPEPVEAKLTVTVSDLMCIASNAIAIMSDFVDKLEDETDLSPEVQNSVNKMTKFLKSHQPKDYMDLDSDFSLDSYEVIMKNSTELEAQDEVLASSNGKGIINVTGRLAEYVRQAKTAEIKLEELQNALIDSDFVKENFWAYRSIDNDLDEARLRLEPLLANTMRVRS